MIGTIVGTGFATAIVLFVGVIICMFLADSKFWFVRALGGIPIGAFLGGFVTGVGALFLAKSGNVGEVAMIGAGVGAAIGALMAAFDV